MWGRGGRGGESGGQPQREQVLVAALVLAGSEASTGQAMSMAWCGRVQL
ncbi:hypothetical protein [Pseudonocardia sp. Ae717_Ps2]|nr:hypothetical protein [Pseudonocardia sp. Ae717_Ps2]